VVETALVEVESGRVEAPLPSGDMCVSNNGLPLGIPSLPPGIPPPPPPPGILLLGSGTHRSLRQKLPYNTRNAGLVCRG